MKNYKKVRYKSRKEWLLHRGLGGSSAYVVCYADTPNLTRLNIYDQLVKHEAKKEKETKTMAHGRALEPIIRNFYLANNSNIKLLDYSPYDIYYKNQFLTASLDGLIKDASTNQLGILEIKTRLCRNISEIEKWKNGDIPFNYLLQIVHYFNIIDNAYFCDFIACFSLQNDTFEIIKYRFFRNDLKATIKALDKTENDFIDNYIVKQETPPLDLFNERGKAFVSLIKEYQGGKK